MPSQIAVLHPYDLYDLVDQADPETLEVRRQDDLVRLNGKLYRTDSQLPYKGHTREFLVAMRYSPLEKGT